jgi:hypothetical protein
VPYPKPNITWKLGGIASTTPPRLSTGIVALIQGFDEDYRQGLLGAGQKLAKDMQTWARTNHKWTNRTGAAERSLVGRAVGDPHARLFSVTVVLEHDLAVAPHALYLSLCREGKWDVIRPTTEMFTPRAPTFIKNSVAQRMSKRRFKW